MCPRNFVGGCAISLHKQIMTLSLYRIMSWSCTSIMTLSYLLCIILSTVLFCLIPERFSREELFCCIVHALPSPHESRHWLLPTPTGKTSVFPRKRYRFLQEVMQAPSTLQTRYQSVFWVPNWNLCVSHSWAEVSWLGGTQCISTLMRVSLDV